MDLPLLWEIKKLPFTATLFATVIMSVHLFPTAVLLRSIPDDLRVRTDKKIISPNAQAFRHLSSQEFRNLSNYLQST